MKREPFDRKQGRHKKRRSLETLARNEEHLPPPPPPWMPAATSAALLDLRRLLDPLAHHHV